MDSFLLRPVTVEDAAFLAELSDTTVEVQVEWLKKLRGRNFIGEFEGRPVSWGAIEDGGELRWVVTPAERRKGFGLATGRELLKLAEGECFASIRRSNVASMRIAERLGIPVVTLME